MSQTYHGRKAGINDYIFRLKENQVERDKTDQEVMRKNSKVMGSPPRTT